MLALPPPVTPGRNCTTSWKLRPEGRFFRKSALSVIDWVVDSVSISGRRSITSTVSPTSGSSITSLMFTVRPWERTRLVRMMVLKPSFSTSRR